MQIPATRHDEFSSTITTVTMGRIKVRQGKIDEEKEAAFVKAIKKIQGGSSIRAAAESEGIAKSTLHGRLKGGQSRRKAHEFNQTLGEAEEKSIVKQIEDMDRRGFPMRIDMVKLLALKVL